MSPNLTCFSFHSNLQAQSVEELELKSQHLGEEITQLTAERDGLELSLAERGDKINCLESDLDKCIEKFEYLLSPRIYYISPHLSPHLSLCISYISLQQLYIYVIIHTNIICTLYNQLFTSLKLFHHLSLHFHLDISPEIFIISPSPFL